MGVKTSRLALLAGAMVILAITLTGCSQKAPSTEQSPSFVDNGVEQEPATPSQAPEDSPKAGNHKPAREVSSQGASGLVEGQKEKDQDQDLVIKTDNKVMGSKQEVMDELNKEVDELIKSLDTMESISDQELNF